MATKFRVHFDNKTDMVLYFVIYEKEASVAFQVCGVPPAATADATWKMNFGTALTHFDQDDSRWTGQPIRDAELGQQYKIEPLNGGIPSINPSPVGPATDGSIQLKNTCNRDLNVGFTIDGSLVVVQDLLASDTITYRVQPTYCVAVYHNIKKGSLVDSGVFLGPVKLEFVDGWTMYTVKAIKDGDDYILKDPVEVRNQ
jgi:hypothetical protein